MYHCSSENYLFYGVGGGQLDTIVGGEGGNLCRCVKGHPDEDEALAESECNTECPGDPSFKCGGNFKYNVYKAPYFDCREPTDDYVLDGGPGRYYKVLDNVLWSEANEGRGTVVFK